MFVWDREGYVREASRETEDKDVNEEVQNDPSIVINTIMHALKHHYACFRKDHNMM